MNISALILVLAFLLPDTQTPNFYPGLTSAREASKKSQKEMVIFFSDKNCQECESAWSAFSKDMKATNQYVSTRMSKDDFDGGIFFDMLNLDAVPSWIILSPDGTEKERWSGGWKDANGNATSFDMSVSKTEIKKEKPVAKSTVQPTLPNEKPKTEIAPPTKTAPVTPTVSNAGKFFVQAGYFGSETNAQKLIADLNSKGFNDFEISVEEKDGKSFYRVLKNFPNETSANAEQRKFESAGIATSIKSR